MTQLALSVDGSFMSTIEVRLPEEDMGGLVCLKFWTSDSQDKHFRLLTVIYEPHRLVNVFHSSGPITRHVPKDPTRTHTNPKVKSIA